MVIFDLPSMNGDFFFSIAMWQFTRGYNQINQSIDWFKGTNTGTSHMFYGKIGIVSGQDVPFFVNPLNE